MLTRSIKGGKAEVGGSLRTLRVTRARESVGKVEKN